MTPEKIVEKYGKGVVSDKEAALLVKRVIEGATVSPCVLEIGSGTGMTGRLLSAALLENGIEADIYSIDVDMSRLVVGKQRRFGIIGNVKYEETDAHNLVGRLKRRLGFVFIDGCHCKQCVCRDILSVVTHCATNGYIALHDWGARRKKQGMNVHPLAYYDVPAGLSESGFKDYKMIDGPSNGFKNLVVLQRR